MDTQLTEPPPPPEPVDPEPDPDPTPEPEPLVDDLIEDVSIDGMCGVY